MIKPGRTKINYSLLGHYTFDFFNRVFGISVVGDVWFAAVYVHDT